MTKQKVAVIFGGRSGEHEISVRSARSLIEHIDAQQFDVVPLAIAIDGSWMSPERSLDLLPEETRVKFFDRFSPPNERPVNLFDAAVAHEIDVAFPVLHGTYGEDGSIQGLLEMAGIPYVGCGVLASSTGMDKAFMKTLFRDAGLPICRYVWFLRDEWETRREIVLGQVESKLGFPCFVKPANLGSSVGVSRAADTTQLARAIDLAAEYDRKIIIEEALPMREIECAVIGNDSPEASLPGEYLIRDESKAFLDYNEKYSGTGNNEFVVPAPVSDELSARIRQMAILAYKAIDGSGLARVDFFLRSDNGALIVNEINTMPGLTDASGFPKMWAGSGRPFSRVIEDLIELALARHRDKLRNRTSR
jgi:D-alanine-D-alanine ligase